MSKWNTRKFRVALVCLLGTTPIADAIPTSAYAASTAPQVVVAQGRLEGIARDGYDAFLGIPFAAAPVGQFRWAPPQASKLWPGIRQAAMLQNECLQSALVPPFPQSGSEDCLFLNVYRPRSQTLKKPVIVWFHGGGFTNGSAQLVDGSVLSQRADAIIVTVNYRLGIFGFLSLPQLDAESKEHTSGNYGLLDQQAALIWVHANIATFGGDPANITLMGQSAGGESIWIHLSSPAVEKLFQRAIVLSGPVLGGRTKIEEQEKGASSHVVARLNCGANPDVVSCIRAQPAATVYEAGGGLLTRLAGWRPIEDGIVVRDTALKLAQSDTTRVPIFSGSVAQEGGFWVQARRAAGIADWTADNYHTYLRRIPVGDAVEAQYPLTSYASPDDAYSAIVTDSITCGNVAMKRAALANQRRFIMYQFNDPDAPSTVFDVASPAKGPFHVADVPYFFQKGVPNETRPDVRFTAVQKALSDRMIADVRAFAHGDQMDGARWGQDSVLVFTPQADRQVPLDDFAAQHKCGFWAGVELKQTPL